MSNISTVDALDWITPFWRIDAVLFIVGSAAASLAFTHEMQVSILPTFNNQKSLKTLSNVPAGTKSLPGENSYFRPGTWTNDNINQ